MGIPMTRRGPPPPHRSFSHVRRVSLPRLGRSRSTRRAVICFLPLVCALPRKFPLGVQAEGMQRSEQHSVILNDLMYINPVHPPPPRRTSPYVFLDVTSTRRRRCFFPVVSLLESYSTTLRSLVTPEGVHSFSFLNSQRA